MTTNGHLAEHERRIVAAARTGELVDLRVGDPEKDDPAQGAAWDKTRTVRAELLIELLTAEPTPDKPRPRSVKIRGARITGTLDLEACALHCPLLLDDCYFDEVINLKEATAPTIKLPGSHLPGLSADQLRTIGNLGLHRGFTATGEIRLLGAHIGGQLNFNGAQLTSPGGTALTADGISVDQDMFCGEGFTATGEIRLLGAHIGGVLSFIRATLTNPNGNALNADRITIDQSMFCREGFTATGEIRLPGAHIGGQLSFIRATLTNPDGLAVDLEAARVAELMLLPARRPEGIVDLTNARIGAFHDDQATWAPVMRMRGFTYETLENDRIGVGDRLRWLKRHPGGYTPQVYDQLADAYRRAGHAEAARKVGVAKQRRRRSAVNPINWLLYLTVGYGYRTWLAGVWLAGLAALGSWLFTRAYPQHMIKATPNAPAFHAVAYTVDLLLPIGDLGQEKAWIPEGWARNWAWLLIGAGWFLTTAAVAGLTGIFKRD